MKICAACCEELTKESFSKKQWQMKQHQRRCKECIDANRDVQWLMAPPTDDTAAGMRNPSPPCTADDEGASCWICLEEGTDELGKPLVRNCSCRGEFGFAHLSCIIQYAEQKSRCVHDSVNGFLDDFNGPWGKCPNCKQRYMNELALDLATAFLTFTESNYPGSERYHFEALSKKLEALATAGGVGQIKESKKIANKILIMAEQFKRINSSPSERHMQIEACAYHELGRLYHNEGTKESSKIAMNFFETCRDIYKSMGRIHDVATAEANLAIVKSNWIDGSNHNMSVEEELERVRKAYKHAVDQEGEESHHTICVGINLAVDLKMKHHAIEAERLHSKIASVSNRVHGPDHELTQLAESRLQFCKARFVFSKTDRGLLIFQDLRYEGDGEKCIVYGPLESGVSVSNPGNVSEDQTTTFATKNTNPKVGTPVICQGLKKSNHLNGKLGEIRLWDQEKTGRYEVHFEDNRLKPCLVKPENVRIVFDLPDE